MQISRGAPTGSTDPLGSVDLSRLPPIPPCAPLSLGLASVCSTITQVKGSDKEQKGTGLGLSITKKFSELLGGSVSVASEVGRGSTSAVRVPVVYRET